MSTTHRRILFGVIASLVAVPAWSEVMDKEPSSSQFLALAVVGSLVGVVAWPVRWWLGAIGFTVFAPLVLGFHWELNHASIGPHIRAEAGPLYVARAYRSMAVFVVGHLIGIALGLWRRGRRREPANPPMQPTGSARG